MRRRACFCDKIYKIIIIISAGCTRTFIHIRKFRMYTSKNTRCCKYWLVGDEQHYVETDISHFKLLNKHTPRQTNIPHERNCYDEKSFRNLFCIFSLSNFTFARADVPRSPGGERTFFFFFSIPVLGEPRI